MMIRFDSQRTAVARCAASVLLGVAMLLLATGCSTTSATRGALRIALDQELQTGVARYEAGDFEGAAEAFERAELRARTLRLTPLACEAHVSQCTSWLRAREPGELATCTQRFESFEGRKCARDPDVQTLIAMGAIAGGQPMPELRLPDEVERILWDAARGGEGR